MCSAAMDLRSKRRRRRSAGTDAGGGATAPLGAEAVTEAPSSGGVSGSGGNGPREKALRGVGGGSDVSLVWQ